MSFEYLLEKIKTTPFSEEPFKHLYIRNFFNELHFKEITTAPEIKFEKVDGDEALFDKLFKEGYKVIGFPGTITDKNKYIEWHKNKEVSSVTNSACVGFGVVLRLERPVSSIVLELNDFLGSSIFQEAIAQRYKVNLKTCNYDAGIQKYLDGYEISPHPDVRRKALTYMVNINSSLNSEAQEIHTHYLKFSKPFEYIKTFWDGNEVIDRCWVPWDWCTTELQQRENNSFVLFSPSNDTMHAVKASYDHLEFQRTQLYGNLWYANPKETIPCKWEDLVITGSAIQERNRIKNGLKAMIPNPLMKGLKNLKSSFKKSSNENIGKREY